MFYLYLRAKKKLKRLRNNIEEVFLSLCDILAKKNRIVDKVIARYMEISLAKKWEKNGIMDEIQEIKFDEPNNVNDFSFCESTMRKKIAMLKFMVGATTMREDEKMQTIFMHLNLLENETVHLKYFHRSDVENYNKMFLTKISSMAAKSLKFEKLPTFSESGKMESEIDQSFMYYGRLA